MTLVDPPRDAARRWSICRHLAGVSCRRIDHRLGGHRDGGRSTPNLCAHLNVIRLDNVEMCVEVARARQNGPSWTHGILRRPGCAASQRPPSMRVHRRRSMRRRDTPTECRQIDHRHDHSGADRPPSTPARLGGRQRRPGWVDVQPPGPAGWPSTPARPGGRPAARPGPARRRSAGPGRCPARGDLPRPKVDGAKSAMSRLKVASFAPLTLGNVDRRPAIRRPGRAALDRLANVHSSA